MTSLSCGFDLPGAQHLVTLVPLSCTLIVSPSSAMRRKKQKLDESERQPSGDSVKTTTPTQPRTSRVSMSAALDLLVLHLSAFHLFVCVRA